MYIKLRTCILACVLSADNSSRAATVYFTMCDGKFTICDGYIPVGEMYNEDKTFLNENNINYIKKR